MVVQQKFFLKVFLLDLMHLTSPFSLYSSLPSSCKKKAVEPNAVSPPALMILTTLDSQVILLEIEDLVLHTKLNKIKIFLIL